MLTYKGLRYNGTDQEFIRQIMADIAELQQQVKQLLAQSKTESRVKP